MKLFPYIVIQKEPPTPPSAAQGAAHSHSPFLQSVKRLLTNRNYILLLTSYGINVGVFYAISTLLNQIVLSHFPGHEDDAGQIGLCIIIFGMAGSVVGGIVLDKTHRFKETTLVIYALSMISMWIYTFTISTNIIVVYATSSLLGFFMTGYLPVGFEFAAELTYPEPEGTSAGILNASAQVFGIVFTIVFAQLLNQVGDIPANCTMSGMLVLGTLITTIISSDLRRQNAQTA